MGGEAGFTNQFEGEKIGVQKKKSDWSSTKNNGVRYWTEGLIQMNWKNEV